MSEPTPEPIPELPRRLTQAQIIGMLLQRGSREHSSVTLSRNAKGETQIEVVVRSGESDEIETVDDAAVKAEALYERLRNRFPYTSGDVPATGEAPRPRREARAVSDAKPEDARPKV